MDGAEWLASESNRCRPRIPERPFDCWNATLNAFTAGGVADGDWPSGGLEGILQAPECLHIFRQEKIGIRGRANRRPTEATTEVCMQTPWRIVLLFVDIQLWFPPADMVNVDVRENIPMVCLLDCRLVGSLLFAWSEPHGQP